MAKTFGAGKFPLKCLQCGHEFTETITKLETSPNLPCPACSVVTHYDAQDLRRSMRDVDNSMDKLRNAFKKLGKPR